MTREVFAYETHVFTRGFILHKSCRTLWKSWPTNWAWRMWEIRSNPYFDYFLFSGAEKLNKNRRGTKEQVQDEEKKSLYDEKLEK